MVSFKVVYDNGLALEKEYPSITGAISYYSQPMVCKNHFGYEKAVRPKRLIFNNCFCHTDDGEEVLLEEVFCAPEMLPNKWMYLYKTLCNESKTYMGIYNFDMFH